MVYKTRKREEQEDQNTQTLKSGGNVYKRKSQRCKKYE